MYRRLWAVALVLLVLVMTGTPAGAYGTRARTQQTQRTFYLIAGITTDPFYLTMYRGARIAARRLGVKLVFLGAPDAFSPASQIPYVDLAIAQRVDAILIAPTDKTALDAPLRRAVRAGIPVITLDTSVTAPLAVTHISSRNVQGGALAARTLVRAIPTGGSVIGVSVRPGVSTTDQREQGFAREVQRLGTVRYLGTYYDNDIVTRAARLTAAQLDRHPALAGIFAMNALSGAGAISAIVSAHKMRQVKLVEFDAEPLQVFSLQRGIVDALIAQDPWTMGNLGVRLAYRWVSGHRSGIKRNYATAEVVITRANVSDPRLRRFLYTGQ